MAAKCTCGHAMELHKIAPTGTRVWTHCKVTLCKCARYRAGETTR
jgi:hypothetical protein